MKKKEEQVQLNSELSLNNKSIININRKIFIIIKF